MSRRSGKLSFLGSEDEFLDHTGMKGSFLLPKIVKREQRPCTARLQPAINSLLCMFLAALAVRLVISALMIPEHLNPARDHWKFGWEMGRVARSIYDGNGFSSPFLDPSGPTAILPPVYPYLIAGCMKLFSGYTVASTMAILSINSFFGSITVIPIYFLTKRVFDERTAVVTGWVWAFFPYSIYLSAGRIWADTLTCMIASFIWLQTIRLDDSRVTGDWLLWGALWALGAMINPALLAPLPFLALWLIVRRRRTGRPWLLPTLLGAAILLALITPWTIRNFQTFHRLIPLRDGFWLELHLGNNGDTSDVTPDSGHPTTNPTEYKQWMQLGEIGYMDAKKVEALAFIRNHPGFFAWVSLRHVVYLWTGFWSLDPKFLADEPFHIPNVMFTTAMTLLLIMGLRYAWQEGKGQVVFPLVLVLITFPMVYYITHPSMDFRHPLDPIIVMMDCYCVLEWWRRHTRKAALGNGAGTVA